MQAVFNMTIVIRSDNRGLLDLRSYIQVSHKVNEFRKLKVYVVKTSYKYIVDSDSKTEVKYKRSSCFDQC